MTEMLNFFDLEVLTCFGGSYTSLSHVPPSCPVSQIYVLPVAVVRALMCEFS